MAPECRRRNIAWVGQMDADLPEVSLDAAQIEQALLNIIKNAVEAIEQAGTITLALHRTPAGPRLTLSDTGPGIPPGRPRPALHPLLHDQGVRPGHRLTLVREILLAHGFEFSLESGAGQTEFSILFATR